MTSLTETIAAALGRAVPWETFRYALEIYQQAARGVMPGSHIPKPEEGGGPGYYLTNIPINRGMMAIMREFRHLDELDRQALGMRIMSFGEAVNAAQGDPRFSEHFKPSDEDGALMVSDSFSQAYAECPFLQGVEDFAPDMDAIFHRAEEIRAAEDSE